MKPQKGWEIGSTSFCRKWGWNVLRSGETQVPSPGWGLQVITLPPSQQERRGSFYGSPRLGDSGIPGTAEIREKAPYTKQGLQWKCKSRPNTPPHCPSTLSRKGGIQVNLLIPTPGEKSEVSPLEKWTATEKTLMDATDVDSWGPPPPTLSEMAEIPAQSIFSDAQELTNPTCIHRAPYMSWY